jgi:hypothetical protein
MAVNALNRQRGDADSGRSYAAVVVAILLAAYA